MSLLYARFHFTAPCEEEGSSAMRMNRAVAPYDCLLSRWGGEDAYFCSAPSSRFNILKDTFCNPTILAALCQRRSSNVANATFTSLIGLGMMLKRSALWLQTFGLLSLIGATHAADFGSTVIAPPPTLRGRRSGIQTAIIRTNAPRHLIRLAKSLEHRAPVGLAGSWTIGELVEYLTAIGIPTSAPRSALEDLLVEPSDRVVVRNLGLSIGSTLTEALGEIDLGWTINKTMDTVLIASEDRISEELFSLVYDVGSLAEREGAEELMDVLTSNVEPSSWDRLGGPGTLVVRRSGRQMLVSQSFHVHGRLKAVIEGMASLYAASSLSLPSSAVRPDLRFGASTTIALPSRPKKRGIGLPNTDGSPSNYGGMGGGMMGAGGMF